MNDSSKDSKLKLLLSKLDVIIKKNSKKHNLDIEDENELRSSTYLMFSEACKNVFVCKRFFSSNEDTTLFLEEYMIPKMEEWITGYLNIKASELCSLDSLSFLDVENAAIQNIEPFDIEDIIDILAKLPKEEKIRMLKFLYHLEQGDIALFGNRDLNVQLIPVLKNYFTHLQVALNKRRLLKH